MVTVSTDDALLDVNRLHRWLSEDAYWSLGRSRETVEASLAGSVNLGAYDGADQVGFLRIVTDRATFAWICDVYVDPAARGKGVGTALVVEADRILGEYGVRRALLARRTPTASTRVSGSCLSASPVGGWPGATNPPLDSPLRRGNPVSRRSLDPRVHPNTRNGTGRAHRKPKGWPGRASGVPARSGAHAPPAERQRVGGCSAISSGPSGRRSPAPVRGRAAPSPRS